VQLKSLIILSITLISSLNFCSAQESVVFKVKKPSPDFIIHTPKPGLWIGRDNIICITSQKKATVAHIEVIGALYGGSNEKDCYTILFNDFSVSDITVIVYEELSDGQIKRALTEKIKVYGKNGVIIDGDNNEEMKPK
jgi:hypothetical protein